jgi:hypothetical protein
MPDEELRFALKIDPDLKAVDAALARTAKQVEATAAGISRTYGQALAGAVPGAAAPTGGAPYAGLAGGGVPPHIAANIARINRAGTFSYEAARAAGALPPPGGYGAGAGGIVGGAVGGIGATGGMISGLTGMAGGAAGMALGGPVGAMIGKVAGQIAGSIAEAVPAAIGSVIAAPAKIAAMGLEGLGHSLRELQGPLGPVGLGLDAVGKSLQVVSNVVKMVPLVGSILGPFTDALAGIPGTLKDITTSLTRMAAVASPGAFKVWEIALEDVQGVIGQRFLPILDTMREGVRLFGDVLATFLPTGEEVAAAMGELRAVFAEMGREVRAAAGEMGPQIRGALIEGLKTLAHWAAVAARAVGILAVRLSRTFAPAATAGTLGVYGGAAAGAGAESSYGAAARAASITGFEEYERQLQVAAFREPGYTDPGLAAAQEAAASLAEIDAQALDLANKMEEWAKFIGGVLVAIKDAVVFIKDLVGAPAKFGQSLVDDTMKGLRQGESLWGATARSFFAAPGGGRAKLGM